jgi:hyaluronoglucosaminidase
MPQVQGSSFINGGIPQLGNLTLHLEKLARDLRSLLPQPALTSGYCLLDYVFWRADWNSTPPLYRNLSIEHALALDPALNESAAVAAATVQFEAAARVFLEASLHLAVSAYPLCGWGLWYGLLAGQRFRRPRKEIEEKGVRTHFGEVLCPASADRK